MLEISTELGKKLCSLYHREKVVCPPEVKCSLFTTAAVDNIDHNPSSTSSHDAFHGTCISLSQHIPTVTIVVFLGLSLLQVIVPPDIHHCLPDNS